LRQLNSADAAARAQPAVMASGGRPQTGIHGAWRLRILRRPGLPSNAGLSGSRRGNWSLSSVWRPRWVRPRRPGVPAGRPV